MKGLILITKFVIKVNSQKILFMYYLCLSLYIGIHIDAMKLYKDESKGMIDTRISTMAKSGKWWQKDGLIVGGEKMVRCRLFSRL